MIGRYRIRLLLSCVRHADRVKLDLGVTLRAIVLTTIPDSTSQKFLVFGTLARGDVDAEGRYATVFLDFLPLQNRKCTDKDMERWYARPQEDKQCLLGHKVGLEVREIPMTAS